VELYLTHAASLYITLLHPLYLELDIDSLRAGRSGDRIPVEEIFCNRPDLPRGPPNLLYNVYRVFPGGKGGRGHGVDHPPHLAPRLKKVYSSTSTSL